jgi:hypothetical protein
MKKLITIVLITMAQYIVAQHDLFTQITGQIKKDYPEINLENKLLIINTWSSSNLDQRDFNVQMNKALITFGSAKLKGGIKGIIGVVINTADDSNLATIILNKDQANSVLPIDKTNLQLENVSNLVFDSQGKIIYSGLQASTVYNSIHQLITR